MSNNNFIIDFSAPILLTGANGFIGSRVVERLLKKGFTNLKCFVRPSGNHKELLRISSTVGNKGVQLIEGNLLSRDDCARAADQAEIVFHLAAGIEKTFPGCFMNSVVTTRNLLESIAARGALKRFVNVSSLAVYSNQDCGRGAPLDETSEVDHRSHLRHEAYAFGKVKQDELLLKYADQFGIPYVIVRPGDVYGRGKKKIPGKVGIDTFGIFLHIGGSRKVPLTHVENCAEAIALAGLVPGIEGETFNIIDDSIPTSRQYLRMFKKNARWFGSIRMPYSGWYLFCLLWERYSSWSGGQLPPVFNGRRCIAGWKRKEYSNRKTKDLLHWTQVVSTRDGMLDYFQYMRSESTAK